MHKSIYDTILENIVDGKLKEGFSLRETGEEKFIIVGGKPNEGFSFHETGGAGFVFADGAPDGITLYHFGQTEMDADGRKQMIRALNAANRDEHEAERLFAKLAEKYTAVGIVDAFQKYIMNNRSRLRADALCSTAFYMITTSANAECVKYGLEILELMSNLDETDKTMIRTLGLCDEFSAQAVWIFSRLEGGNDEIFNLAKNLSGWGRIHAVAALKPETPEIRRWLLFEGIDNYVLPQYSALAVWVKAGVGEMLKGEISDEEFHAVSRILYALVDEGPAEGISDLGDPGGTVREYLEIAETKELDVVDYQTIYGLRDWATDENDDYSDIVLTCSDILTTEICEETIRKAAKEGRSYGEALANALGIDYTEDGTDE